MNFELKCVGGPYGDECSDYIGIFKKQMTLADFILKKEIPQNEWGEIYINGHLLCHYKQNNSFYNIDSKCWKKFKDSKILSLSAYGGWTLMKYYLEIEEMEVKEYENAPKMIFDDGFIF